ncbi:hypothetical protein ASPWEDRAFT_129787 [Aspergillus wentii DTO 134E9]|uniref:dihydropyrimidinase n=1 Tax=Aspergillus wentii DTO 134E9 TaxID=1073089 RepID=A0A1L9RMZ3_ASPWE|nr:uncharacterized protein ASPWEDRAFT_129787 [Aspergillus wentii DTO 134E9]KAI9923441.1 hypothetical protein MW887_009322 [Aspergillus wentii]OJJ36272.1 hypothetical protein ASPWEDRAFT_129787 [Aspergillus wentii DTO 134E9]
MKVTTGIDLIIINATIATASDIIPNQEIAISNGKILLLGQNLQSISPTTPALDAQGGYVMPGGIDSHVHLAQDNSPTGDNWETGTRSAIAGGTTTVLAFASQKRTDESVIPVIKEYHRRAVDAHCDYGFHLILTNPTQHILQNELPLLVKEGITSVKIYMTYQPMKLGDGQILHVMETTRRLGMTTMVHAENSEMIQWMTTKLEGRRRVEPYAHALARPNIAEDEATYRVISLSELADVPILIVHMSSKLAAKHVRKAQTRLLPVHAETCPHYLLLTSERLRGDDFHGSKCVCSPALREDPMDLQAMWDGLSNGTFTTVSSDHAPSKFDHPLGKKQGTSTFTQIPNGLPGVETRMPTVFCEGVLTGRLSVTKYVELTSSNPAKLYGLGHCKGTIAPGYDADLVIWYPTAEQAATNGSTMMTPFKLNNNLLHHDIDYTPFEGMEFNNWPRYTILRGKVIWNRDEELLNGKGEGRYVKRGMSTLSKPREVFVNEFHPYE